MSDADKIAIGSLVIALLSMAVAAATAWLTLGKTGTIKMVRPSLIAFLDAHGTDGPKVWFRALMYSTSHKGRVLESMYIRLRRGESQQNFSFWVCGKKGDLASGCGLHVAHTGIALDHHFVLPKDGSQFEFIAGDYVIDLFGTVVGNEIPLLLAHIPLRLTELHAASLKNPDDSVYFDWWPDSARYNAHVVHRPPRPELTEMLTDLFGSNPSIRKAPCHDLPPARPLEDRHL